MTFCSGGPRSFSRTHKMFVNLPPEVAINLTK